MVFFKRLKKRQQAIAAQELYETIVAQARQPVFYLEAQVPDTVDGRYEMISLHAFLLMRRLKREETEEAESLSQAVFDYMFADMDQSLREIGVGDLSVGKRIKEMAKVFYGRIYAYERALDTDEETLEDALERNHYGTVEEGVSKESLVKLADYVRQNDVFIADQKTTDLMHGKVGFHNFATEAS